MHALVLAAFLAAAPAPRPYTVTDQVTLKRIQLLSKASSSSARSSPHMCGGDSQIRLIQTLL
jgi:hypothetical protein